MLSRWRKLRFPSLGWSPASAVATFSIASPPAAWWVIGDQSTAPVDAAPDYFIRPPDFGPFGEAVIGGCAVLVAALSLMVLVQDTRGGRLDRGWWAALIALGVAGMALAYAARILTAGVIGANIGAGLVLLLGGPFVLVLYVFGIGVVVRLRRESDQDAM